MKHAKIFAFALAALAVTGVRAEGSYAGVALGLQFDLASLGKTILLDGLESPTAPPPDVGNASCVSVIVCPPKTAGATSNQQVIVPENKLEVYKKLSFGFIDYNNKNGGPMTGLAMKAFYEKEWTNAFVRAGVNYTRKIKGGDTSSSIAGIEWYHVKFDYRSLITPVYLGLKTNVGETTSFYMGGGLNYYEGGFSLSGTNIGAIPTYILNVNTTGTTNNNPVAQLVGTIGLTPTLSCPATGSQNTGTAGTTNCAVSPTKAFGLYGDHVKFNAAGVGFNFVMGIEKKLESGDKLFFEFEQIIAGENGDGGTHSIGGYLSFAPLVSYPQNLSGTVYTVGYKMHM